MTERLTKEKEIEITQRSIGQAWSYDCNALLLELQAVRQERDEARQIRNSIVNNCGCNYHEPYGIEYCAMHTAAPELHAQLAEKTQALQQREERIVELEAGVFDVGNAALEVGKVRIDQLVAECEDLNRKGGDLCNAYAIALIGMDDLKKQLRAAEEQVKAKDATISAQADELTKIREALKGEASL